MTGYSKETLLWHAQRLRPYIEAALPYAGGTHTYDDIVEECLSGAKDLWPGQNSVMITGVVDYPRLSYLHFFLAGGNIPELRGMLPPILDYGRLRGCTRASLSGRPGWLRSFLRHEGWNPSPLISMELDLNG